jgi:hypothetical protein
VSTTTVHVESGQAIIYQHGSSDEVVAHEPIQVPIDETVSLRQLARLWVRATVVGTAVLGVFVVVALAFANVAALDTGIAASVVAFCAAFLRSEVDEPLGEWRALLAERAPYEASVYSLIVGDLARSRLPASVRTYRQHDATGAVVNRLVLGDRRHTVDVTVFSYGTSLCLGWQMHRRRSGVALLNRAWIDVARSMRRGAGHASSSVETEQPYALRQAVHLSCTRGLKTALERTSVPLDFGFPAGVPPIASTLPSAMTVPRLPDPLVPAAAMNPPQTPEGHGRAVGSDGAAAGDLTLPVSIYLTDLRAYQQVEAAVEALLVENGYEVVHRGEPVIGG